MGRSAAERRGKHGDSRKRSISGPPFDFAFASIHRNRAATPLRIDIRKVCEVDEKLMPMSLKRFFALFLLAECFVSFPSCLVLYDSDLSFFYCCPISDSLAPSLWVSFGINPQK
jgi:hypothetical protein